MRLVSKDDQSNINCTTTTTTRWAIKYRTILPRCMEHRRGLAMRILSVHLSVKIVHCDKTEERSVQIFIPYERSFTLVF